MSDSSQISQYFLRRAPPSPTPNWERREIRNYRRQKTNRGTPRNAAEPGGTPKFGQPALEYAIFWRTPPKFPNIFCAGHPLSQHPIGQGGGAKLPNAKRGTAAHHGAPRNAAERLNLAIPPWNPPYFGGFLPNSPIFFTPDPPPFPTPNWGRWKIRNYRRQNTNRGSPRNDTEPDGTQNLPTRPGIRQISAESSQIS